MTIDYTKIKAVFPDKAWAYAERYNEVEIGKWDGNKLVFHSGLEEEYLLVLRVFNDERELKFEGGKCRDTAIYDGKDFVPELADAKYYMYGKPENEEAEVEGEYIKLQEKRGGVLYFPNVWDNPKDRTTALKLSIKNFVRYNGVPILTMEDVKAKKTPDFGISKTGAGALELVDYAYTGFWYADREEAVKL